MARLIRSGRAVFRFRPGPEAAYRCWVADCPAGRDPGGVAARAPVLQTALWPPRRNTMYVDRVGARRDHPEEHEILEDRRPFKTVSHAAWSVCGAWSALPWSGHGSACEGDINAPGKNGLRRRGGPSTSAGKTGISPFLTPRSSRIRAGRFSGLNWQRARGTATGAGRGFDLGPVPFGPVPPSQA